MREFLTFFVSAVMFYVGFVGVPTSVQAYVLYSLHPDSSSTLEHPGVTTWQVCVEKCKANDSCEAAVYSKKFQGCYLKTGSLSRWSIWPEGDTWVKSAEVEITFQNRHPDASDTLEHPGVTSYDACLDLCRGNDRCRAMVYSKKFQGCYLKTGRIAGWRTWPEGDTVVLGR